MGIINSALGALGSTYSSSGWNTSHSEGGTMGSGASVTEFNREMMKAQQAFNSAEAQKQRDWQERMSNTAYQRAIEDMKKAGINPILAYQQGGATTPGGSAASAGMASGATDNYNMSDALGMNSAASYSNFAEGLAGLGEAMKSAFGGFSDILGWIGGGTGALKSMGKAAAEALSNAQKQISDMSSGYNRYMSGREWK